jgi:hypothetical protein
MFLNVILILPFLYVAEFEPDAIATSPLLYTRGYMTFGLSFTTSDCPSAVADSIVDANLRV